MDASWLGGGQPSVSDDYRLFYPLPIIIDWISSLGYDTLSIAASIIFSFAYYRVAQFPRDATKLKRSLFLLGVKLITATCLIGTEVATVVALRSTLDHQHSIIAAAISCLAAVVLAAAISLEHLYTTCSTAIVALSLSVALVLDWLRLTNFTPSPALREIKALGWLAFGLKCALLYWNEFRKELPQKSTPANATESNDAERMAAESMATESTDTESIDTESTDTESTETESTETESDEAKEDEAKEYGRFGFWTRILFSGFNTKRVINESSTTQDAESLAAKFQSRWNKVDTQYEHCLLISIARVLAVSLLRILALRVLLSYFTLSQATFLRHYCAIGDQPDLASWDKLFLLGASALTHVGMAASRSHLQDFVNRVANKLQLVLATTAHTKLNALPCSEAQKPQTINLANSDIDDVAHTLLSVCSVACDFLEVIICGRWLIQSVGHIAAFVDLVIVFHMMLHRHLSDTLNDADLSMDESTSTRIENASQMLSQIKVIQMVGLTKAASTQHAKLRADEVKQYMKVADALSNRVKNASFYYAAPGLFILGMLHFTSPTGRLRAEDAFSTLYVVYLHFEALRRSVQTCGDIRKMMYSLNRMQALFFAEEASNPATSSRESSEGASGAQSSATITAIPTAESSSSSHPDYVVDMREASLTMYSATQPSILTNLTCSIKRYELVMVAGPVACGKSTLLCCLVGDGVRKYGKFYREPGIAGYCDQQPWLQHASIQDNIIGRKPFELDWYNAILDACLLTEELHQLVKGDRTIIGNNSSNLSYGQEHRVALARALYMRPPYLVLDGVFGALDRETADAVFNNIFGEGGLLEQSPSTVVLSTHSKSLLSRADKVILLDSNKLVTVHTDMTSPSFHARLAGLSLAEEHDKSGERRRNGHSHHFAAPESDDTHEEPGFSDQLYNYLSSFDRARLNRLFVFMCISGFGISLREYIVYLWLQYAPGSTRAFVAYVTFTTLTSMILTHGIRLWYLELAPVAATNWHQQLLDNTMEANIAYITRTPHQTLLNLYGSDLRSLTRQMPKYFISFVHASFTSIIQIALLWVLTQYAFVILLFLLLGSCIALVGYSVSARRVQLRIQKNKVERNAALFETASGLRHIRAFGWESYVTERNSKLLQASQASAFEMKSTDRWLEFVLDITKGLATVVALAFAVFIKNRSPASITAVTIMVLAIYSENFVLYVQDLTMMRACLRALNRIQRAIKAMQPFQRNLTNPDKLVNQWPTAGNVTFNSVTASYDDKSLTRPALKMLSLSIASGQKVAIVGRTGSGKSSVLLSLLNYLDFKGNIIIDGIDISLLPATFLREQISTISTEVIELEGTVRSNICPWTNGEPLKKGDIHWFSIELVLTQLGLWDTIQCQSGLDNEMKNLTLTIEQRRLLSVARGMLYNLHIGSNLVLMDETGNDLDPATEAIVDEAMKEVFDDHTVIRVVSRPEVLEHMDVTILMLDGRIAEVSHNPNGPAAVKARDAKRDEDERRHFAAQRAAGIPVNPRPVDPFYEKLMYMNNNPYAVPGPGPHQADIEELQERRERLMAERRRQGLGHVDQLLEQEIEQARGRATE